jgi:hypothetical protein
VNQKFRMKKSGSKGVNDSEIERKKKGEGRKERGERRGKEK